MTDTTAREVIAAVPIEPAEHINPRADFWLIGTEQADAILSALSAAGIGTYDTKTHVVVPREPTKAMTRAAIRANREDRGIIGCYRAMLAAVEKESK